ncbi:MAG: hypothetical protein K8F92_03030 [Hyphomicrobium sp.]|uniref:hypothetical protein n=1 Tax=Hyphomicrobium sp. TaxID=82 RepID=UPI0013239D12|nr:hypothetical protein [Hyphomicrobium sp.]KAB2942631.1 MAG: hypothetical protein F9K20_06515 [Hyphomicrobium sp.]MBZ0208615.1 hypothetical protein [Hyphomicrobium sp.]MCZ7594779.1 hypothetical protein [Hyphomicrobium sp.]
MDAATLYTVMAVGSGPKRMTTERFPTMAICERAAEKLRKRAPLKAATFYCVKRKPDAGERAAAAAARSRPTPAGQGQAQAQAQAPVGMPRDFFSGTTPKQ